MFVLKNNIVWATFKVSFVFFLLRKNIIFIHIFCVRFYLYLQNGVLQKNYKLCIERGVSQEQNEWS